MGKRKRRRRDYEDWSPWVRRIGLAIIFILLALMAYWVASFAWKNLHRIKRSYDIGQRGSSRPEFSAHLSRVSFSQKRVT